MTENAHMRIRHLLKEDFPRLWKMDWDPLIKERDSIYLIIAVDQRDISFVAENENGDWLGVLLATRSSDGRSCYINHLLVIPQYRGGGVGTALMERLRSACMELGIRRIWFFTAPRNRTFYERMGFVVDDAFIGGPARDYVRRCKQALTMKLDVQPPGTEKEA